MIEKRRIGAAASDDNLRQPTNIGLSVINDPLTMNERLMSEYRVSHIDTQ